MTTCLTVPIMYRWSKAQSFCFTHQLNLSVTVMPKELSGQLIFFRILYIYIYIYIYIYMYTSSKKLKRTRFSGRDQIHWCNTNSFRWKLIETTRFSQLGYWVFSDRNWIEKNCLHKDIPTKHKNTMETGTARIALKGSREIVVHAFCSFRVFWDLWR